MKNPRIYVTENLADKILCQLDKASAHHVATVLRKKIGDQLILFNGDGLEYFSRIIDIDKKKVSAEVFEVRTVQRESQLFTELGQGISRGERMDYVLQKAVELGVTQITPLFTERCNVKLNAERVENRMQHWRKVMISACEQSGRVCLPSINKPQRLSDWLKQSRPGVKIVCSPEGKSLPKMFTEQATLLIGPEGGLTTEEVASAVDNGFSSVKFGPRILRTETAAVVAMTMVQAKWGDLGAI